MGIVSKEQRKITNYLLTHIIELAKKHDGLIEPDEGTELIMLKCIGIGFSLGEAYSLTETDWHWRKRLSKAFEIVALKGNPDEYNN